MSDDLPVKLPFLEQAVIPERKITVYLLSPSHPQGRTKAAYFMRFGFSAAAWQKFADALRRHAAAHDVAEETTNPFGTAYTVEGALETPDGRDPVVRVVWFIDRGGTAPRLVTAYLLT